MNTEVLQHILDKTENLVVHAKDTTVKSINVKGLFEPLIEGVDYLTGKIVNSMAHPEIKNDVFLETSKCIDRLITIYGEHKHIVIGVDFDDTLYDTHNAGISFEKTVEVLKRAQLNENVLCVWTANADSDKVKRVWTDYGLRINYYNTSPLTPSVNGKQHFNILLDDRAGLGQTIEILEALLDYQDAHPYGGNPYDDVYEDTNDGV